jgi:hypothetical protein
MITPLDAAWLVFSYAGIIGLVVVVFYGPLRTLSFAINFALRGHLLSWLVPFLESRCYRSRA